MLARSCKLRGVTDPYVAELLGVREDVRLAMEKGWTQVAVEKDCQNCNAGMDGHKMLVDGESSN